MIRTHVAALVIASAFAFLLTPSFAQDIPPEALGLQRDQPTELRVLVEGMTPDASRIGLEEEDVLDAVEDVLREAGLVPIEIDDLVTDGAYLYVNVNTVEDGANIGIEFNRLVEFEFAGGYELVTAATWDTGGVGTWARVDGTQSEFVLSGVREYVGYFVEDYALANAEALNASRAPSPPAQSDAASDIAQTPEQELPELDVLTAHPRSFLAPGGLDSTLGDETVQVDGMALDLYSLQALESGELVEVVMTSDDIDTYLVRIDPKTGRAIDENDDDGSIRRSSLRIRVPSNRTVWIAATSFHGNEVGSYRLVVNRLD